MDGLDAWAYMWLGLAEVSGRRGPEVDEVIWDDPLHGWLAHQEVRRSDGQATPPRRRRGEWR
jgi:hypothetical protein